MKYINTKTGAIVDSPCIIEGENWEVLEEKENKIKKETSKTKK